MFRGREIVHPQIGKALLDRIYEKLEEVGTMEKAPSLEGRHMTMIIVPDKRKIAAREKALEEESVKGEDEPSADQEPESSPAEVVAETTTGDDKGEETATDVPEAVAGP